MKKMCALTISFLLLKFSLILCCLKEPICFWRLKNNEDNDGDLRSDCGFFLAAVEGPTDDSYNISDLR